MRWCTGRTAIGTGFLAALLFAVATGCGPARQTAELPGTSLDRVPAPDFTLTDQLGRPVAMSGLRGNVVVLTFLYTSCPDVCPLTAQKLKQTLERLGPDAGHVVAVAVSVDPARDDQAAAAAFSRLHGMPSEQWHYLIGTEGELAPVWASYFIAATPGGGAASPAQVGHTEAVYVIDQDGKERTLLRGDFDPERLAAGVRQLLKHK